MEYMRKMFPDYEDSIKDDPNGRTIFDVLEVGCFNLGYKGVTIVVGQDRLSEFQSLAQKYNGDLYDFEDQVISAGARDPDAEGIEGMSASKMRDAATKDDFKAFAKGIPNLGNMEKKNLFNLLKKSMGVTQDQLANGSKRIRPTSRNMAVCT